ncbi:MAG: LptF/LptG family permease, partial [Gammaproteobacteria bacterium]|nr:LptF/LptG family permease [Gammaproteobacteria bacterium]
TRIGPEGHVEATSAESDRWQTRVTPRVLSVFLVRPEQLSFWQVRHYIRHLAANQQQTEPFELAYWGKLMLPLSTALMVLLAIPFVFVNIRSGGVGRSLFIGIMLGLGFYAVNQGFGYVVLANGISPFLGATVPVAGFLLLAMVMMRRIG